MNNQEENQNQNNNAKKSTIDYNHDNNAGSILLLILIVLIGMIAFFYFNGDFIRYETDDVDPNSYISENNNTVKNPKEEKEDIKKEETNNQKIDNKKEEVKEEKKEDKNYQNTDGKQEEKINENKSDKEKNNEKVNTINDRSNEPTVVDASSISINKTNIEMFVNNNESLIASITPSDVTNKTITWSSSDPIIASVDQTGKVTALKEGTTTITAKTSNGKTATTSIRTVDKEDVFVYFYNPGVKSDAIVIKSGSKTMIIDGGVRTSNGVTNNFINYVKSLGINKVDIYVGTHGHPDHVALAGKIIKEFNIKTIYVPSGDIPKETPIKVANKVEYKNTESDWYTEKNNSAYMNKVYKNYTIALMLKRCESASERLAIESASINYINASSNKITLGKSVFTVLNPSNGNWPTTEMATYSDRDAYNNDNSSYSPLNQNSLMLRMDRGKTSFLFAADVYEPEKYSAIRNKIDVDVYKNGHHHYRLKTDSGGLKARINYISPQYIIMSTDTKSLFNNLDISGINNINIYSVNCGNVIIKSTGLNIEVLSGNRYNKNCNKNNV